MDIQTTAPVLQSYPVDDETIIHLSQTTRRQLLSEVTKKGIPTDKEDRELMMRLLSDMDRTALTNKRIKSDEKNNKAADVARELVAQILNMKSEPRVIEENSREIPVLSNEIPAPVLVPGETDTSAELINYQTFVDRFESQKQD